MEVKPGYKQTEVGLIPNDWRLVNLGEVCSIFGRIGFRGYTVNDIVQPGQGAISISPSNITNDRIDFTRSTYISFYKYEESPEIKIFNGDIVLVKTGSTFGKTAIVKNLSEKATLNPQLVVIKKLKVDNRFLSYMMSFRTIQDQISSTIVGGALPTLSQRQVAQFKLPVPPSEAEQVAIAEALSDADAHIETLEQLAVKKRYLKQGAMQALPTGKRRPPGFEVKSGFKQTEAGEVPKDWNVTSLGSLCDIVAGRDLVKDDFSSSSDHRHEFPIYSNALTDKGLYGYSKTFQFEANKITVTARGDIGHAAYRNSRFCAIGRLLVLSSKRECDLRFVTEFINNFVEFAFESTGVPQLTAPQISKYTVALPPTKAEQEGIATILSDMDSEISALRAELSKGRNIKQGIMQDLVTGRIRLI